MRDIQGIGRGGYYIAGTVGYSVGNLHIPGLYFYIFHSNYKIRKIMFLNKIMYLIIIFFLEYNLPWEEENIPYPNNMASPLEILIQASNGASDYGNKFGEPIICGFTRSFGMIDEVGVRREWIKPIMFSGGLGTMDANMSQKVLPQKGK